MTSQKEDCMKFTNNDLAKAMKLEVGKKYARNNKIVYEVYEYNGNIYLRMLDSTLVLPVSDFLGDELTEVIETPKLTEQEITILKGRQAEGFMTIKRQGSEIYLLTLIVGRGIDMFSDAGLFQTLDELKPYSIAELLKGNE